MASEAAAETALSNATTALTAAVNAIQNAMTTQGSTDKIEAFAFAHLQTAGSQSTYADWRFTAKQTFVDRIKSDEIHMVVNTTIGDQAVEDSRSIRRNAFVRGTCYVTTVPGAWAMVEAIEAAQSDAERHIISLQQLYVQQRSV